MDRERERVLFNKQTYVSEIKQPSWEKWKR